MRWLQEAPSAFRASLDRHSEGLVEVRGAVWHGDMTSHTLSASPSPGLLVRLGGCGVRSACCFHWFQRRADSSDWMTATAGDRPANQSTQPSALFFFHFALLEGLSPPVLSVPKATQDVQGQLLCFCVDVVAHAAQCWMELLGSWRVIVTIGA